MLSGTLIDAMAAPDQVEAAAHRQLLAAAQRGDADAQATIFHRHKHQIARQIQCMTGDDSAVDDLVQEVFISAFSALPGFRGDAQLHTWLYTIALNKVRNWWDSHRRRRLREQRSQLEPSCEPLDPEEDLEGAQHRARLYAAMAQLPDKLREAFTARAVEGMSLQEASELLDVPISTVSYRTRRAEKLLCEALQIPWEEGR